MATPSGSGKKKDNSTLPTLAIIVSCILFAYGFSKGSPLIQWVVPSVLIAGSLAYSLWSRSREKRAARTP